MNAITQVLMSQRSEDNSIPQAHIAQGKECVKLLGSERGKKHFLPWSLWGHLTLVLLTLWVWTLSLQKCERINFCCLKGQDGYRKLNIAIFGCSWQNYWPKGTCLSKQDFNQEGDSYQLSSRPPESPFSLCPYQRIHYFELSHLWT